MTTVAEHRMAVEDLDVAILDLASRINANNYQLLLLLQEFDERCGFLKWGLSSTADWLAWRCDYSPTTAREKVRMARALKVLPKVSAAFASGALSYTKVRAVTRVATVRNEESLVAHALANSAVRVEQRCQQLRNGAAGSVAQARSSHAARSLFMSRPSDTGMVSLHAELPAAEALLLGKALDRAAQQVPDGPEFETSSWAAAQADALVLLAQAFLADDGAGSSKSSSSTAEQYQVLVHVDAAALTQPQDASAEACSDLPIDTVRRLCCDGSVVPVMDSAKGEPLDIGRKQRTVPVAIRRALSARDGGCSFPGCQHTRWVEAHHIKHWADGGATRLDNLIILCSAHHRLLHEGGYSLQRDQRGGWCFLRPDGRAIPRLGYSKADVLDEHAGAETEDASAEAWQELVRSGQHEIREPGASYSAVTVRPAAVADSTNCADNPMTRRSLHPGARPWPRRPFPADCWCSSTELPVT